MRKKLNESVCINVTELRQDFPGMDCNAIRDRFMDEGANVDGKRENDQTLMIVDGLSVEDVEDVLAENVGRRNADKYIISCDNEFPAYDDVDINYDNDEELNEDELSEMDEFDEDPIYVKCKEVVQAAMNRGEIFSDDDIEENLDELMSKIVDDPDELSDEDFEELADLLHQAWEDAEINIEDDVEELPRFERMGRGRRLDEKKKNNCCPTKKVNESLDLVLADIDKKSLFESAFNKLKNENISNTIKNIDKQLLESKVNNALKANKNCLHENVKVNGKRFADLSINDLKSIYKQVDESLATATSDVVEKKQRLLEFIDEEITYRETRNACIAKLNEDSGVISDEELANLFGPAQGEEEQKEESEEKDDNNDSEESSEENANDNEQSDDEEVELSRIEITLDSADALEDFKQACLDAEIPEDAFETEGDEVEEESSEEAEEETEETEEESSEETEEPSEEDTNESYEFSGLIKRLLTEGELADVDNVEEPAEDTEDTEEETEETEEESDEEEKETEYKFILTNTDYASKLAKVLDDVYGISKEEFEEMIGGEIVEESEEESEEEPSDESEEASEESDNAEEKEGDDKKDEKSDEDDEIDPSDLFKGL